MTWRDTWRETVESFMRELHGVEASPAPPGDAVVRAIANARTAAAVVERELRRTEERLAAEEEAVAVCRRRQELAERIGDRDTAGVAERFGRRHAERVAVLRRKREVLRDEHALARQELSELVELARAEVEEADVDAHPDAEERRA